LDDCLYPRSCGIGELVHDRIVDYMVNKLGVSKDTVHELCLTTYHTSGTTFAGLLKAGYTIDADDWHADVHGRLRYAEHLSHDAELRNMLVSLPQYHAGRLFIFTNADDKHADACLTALGIRDLFPKAHVLTFETLQRCAVQRGLPPRQVLCKPQPEAFQVVLDLIGARAQRTLFLDDSTRNVAGAASIGIHAVLVGASEPCPGAIASVLDVRHLHAAVPRLWYAHATEAPAEDGDVAAALEADELEAHTTREAIEVES